MLYMYIYGRREFTYIIHQALAGEGALRDMTLRPPPPTFMKSSLFSQLCDLFCGTLNPKLYEKKEEGDLSIYFFLGAGELRGGGEWSANKL